MFREVIIWIMMEILKVSKKYRWQLSTSLPWQKVYWWGLRTSPHTSYRNGERGMVIRKRGWWWKRGGRWGPVQTIFWVPIVRSFRTWPSSTHDTTLATTWSWGVWPAPTRGITHIALGTGYAYLFVCPDVRQGHRQTIFSRSLGAPSWSRTNRRGITPRGFTSQRGD